MQQTNAPRTIICSFLTLWVKPILGSTRNFQDGGAAPALVHAVQATDPTKLVTLIRDDSQMETKNFYPLSLSSCRPLLHLLLTSLFSSLSSVLFCAVLSVSLFHFRLSSLLMKILNTSRDRTCNTP